MRSFFFLLTSIIICSSVLQAETKTEEIKSFTLENGMKVFVIEDFSIPNANMYLFYKVGSRNEYPGITGLSHFFEHMMFNGAKKYGPKMFDQTMEAAGGSNNAYTSNDVTVYTNWFPASSAEVIFDLEADRIKDLNFDDKMIESERGVVLSERSTWLENSNYVFLSEQVEGAAFIAHPYRWPVIGYESDIKNWSKLDLQNYFKTYYAPNNCVVVVSGAINFDEVKKLATKYFSVIPTGPQPRQLHTVEPPQIGEKRVFAQKDVSASNLMISYHGVDAKSPNYYTLVLLSAILSEGSTSRLYKSLVDEKQLALDITTNFSYSFDPSLFTIYTICSDNVAVSTLENAIYDEIEKLVKDGITEKELEKVKNQKLMSLYQNLETINGRAHSTGISELFFGDYNKIFDSAEEYQKVSVTDIQETAKKYLVKSNRTVGILSSVEEGR
ncbi:MAG: pitrilysin family protein [Ignavibacteria bacterium]|nr:pitrilysin family protein [Ignavibacteria bacterium]